MQAAPGAGKHMVNTRALALGMAFGFVVAVTPSCSGNKCGPNNCGGCCDASGKCVAKPNNQNNSTCGSAGAACENCVSREDGVRWHDLQVRYRWLGWRHGHWRGHCDRWRHRYRRWKHLHHGVHAVERNLCAGSTWNNCGSNGGAACQACATGQVCTNGACTTPSSMKKVGDRCVNDGECKGSLGQSAICKQMTTSGNGTYTGGYCTLKCVAQSGCPTGAKCAGIDPRYGEADTICWDSCATGATRAVSRATPVTPLGLWEARAGSAPCRRKMRGRQQTRLAWVCTDNTQCQNPPEANGICMTRELNRNRPMATVRPRSAQAVPSAPLTQAPYASTFNTVAAKKLTASRDAELPPPSARRRGGLPSGLHLPEIRHRPSRRRQDVLG